MPASKETSLRRGRALPDTSSNNPYKRNYKTVIPAHVYRKKGTNPTEKNSTTLDAAISPRFQRSRVFPPDRMKWILAELRKPEFSGLFKVQGTFHPNTPKVTLYDRLTRGLNEAFGIELTRLQVTQRTAVIVKQFNLADALRVAFGPGPVIGVTQRDQLSKICFCYFELEDAVSVAHDKPTRSQESTIQTGVNPSDVSIEALPAATTERPTVPCQERLGSRDGLDDSGSDSHELVKLEARDVEEEDDEEVDYDEEEPLTRKRPHRQAGSRSGNQPMPQTLTSIIQHPVRPATKPIQRKKTLETLTQDPYVQSFGLAAEHRHRHPRERSTTPSPSAALHSENFPEVLTREHASSIVHALERFTEATLSLVTLHATESKHRQDLALKQQELEYHLNLKRVENEHELRKLEIRRDMEIKKQEHEKAMVVLHIKSLGHSKESQPPNVIVLEDKMNRYVLQRHDPESDSGDWLIEVASSAEPMTKTYLGGPPSPPRNTVDVRGQVDPSSPPQRNGLGLG